MAANNLCIIVVNALFCGTCESDMHGNYADCNTRSYWSVGVCLHGNVKSLLPLGHGCDGPAGLVRSGSVTWSRSCWDIMSVIIPRCEEWYAGINGRIKRQKGPLVIESSIAVSGHFVQLVVFPHDG
jgi:hypothetical protein